MTSNTDNSGKEIVVKNEPTFAVKRRFGKYSGHYELEKKIQKKYSVVTYRVSQKKATL